VQVRRGTSTLFAGDVRTSQIKRPLEELADYLYREITFPRGAFLMTGTGIVPPHDFSMAPGDVVYITIGDLTLENPVADPRAR
jgi:2-dehydro-3-deoxy-D-arabinonate dehydratase